MTLKDNINVKIKATIGKPGENPTGFVFNIFICDAYFPSYYALKFDLEMSSSGQILKWRISRTSVKFPALFRGKKSGIQFVSTELTFK